MTEELEKAIQRIVRNEIDSRIDAGSLLVSSEIDDRKKRHVQKVRNELIRKGYSLEIQVYKKLKKRRWSTELNANYWDVETNPKTRPWEELQLDHRTYQLEKETRTIDVVAQKWAKQESIRVNQDPLGSFTGVNTTLVIECKHSDRKNWAFFLESGLDLIERYDTDRTGPVGLWGSISYLDSLLVEQGHSGMENVKHLPGCDERDDAIEQAKTIANYNWTSHHSPRTMNTAAISGVTLFGEDSLYQAAMQVLNASTHRRAFREIFMFSDRAKRRKYFDFWWVYPVIVFDGPLWSFAIESDKLVIKPLEWTTLYAKRKDNEYAIDVVSLDFLDKYLDVLDDEIEALKEGGIQYPP